MALKPKAQASSKVDVAALQAQLAELQAKLGNATTSKGKGKGPGRPKAATADTVDVQEGNTEMYYNVFFSLNGESTKPDDDTLTLMKKHGYIFNMGANDGTGPHFWGFKRMLPKEIAEVDGRIDFHYES